MRFMQTKYGNICTKYVQISKYVQWPQKYVSIALCTFLCNIQKYARYVSMKFTFIICKNMHPHWPP